LDSVLELFPLGPNPVLNPTLVKGIVQRILRGVNIQLKQSVLVNYVEARPFFFLNFKGTLSQEEHKTIFSGLSEIN
jgi:hypothetical protein